MANYYIDPDGSNTAPYDTWAKAANQPHTAVSHGNGVTGPHTYHIGAGSYTSYLNLDAVNSAGCTVIGGYGGESLINVTAGQNGFSTSKLGIKARGFTLTGTDSTHDLLSTIGADTEIDDVVLGPSGRYQINNGSGGTAFKFRRIRSRALRQDGTISPFYLRGSGDVEMCVFTDHPSYFPPSTSANAHIDCATSGTINFRNCVVAGGRGVTVNQSGSGTSNWYNCMVDAGQWIDSFAIQRSAGTVNIYNSCLGMSVGPTHRVLSGTINTDTGNIKGGFPGFTANMRGGIVVPSIDDYSSLAEAQGLEIELAARGMKGTFNVEGKNFAAGVDALKDMHSGGVVEIGLHAYSHSNLALTGTAFSITKASHTINIDRDADTITVAGASPVVVSGFKAKALNAIRAELTTGGCTLGGITANLSGDTLGESLAGSSVAQASPYNAQLLIDDTGATGFWYVEVVYAKQLAESILEATINSFAPPFGQSTSALAALVKAAGFTNHRVTYPTTGVNLASVDIFNLGYLSSGNFIDAVDANIQKYSHAMARLATHSAFMLCPLTHYGEATQAQWATVLDVFAKYSDLMVTSCGDAVEHIKTSGLWATADGATYTRTYTDESDYHLLPQSVCIGAGVDVGLTTDIDGNAIPGAVGFDIGPYSYMPGWTLFDESMPDLTLSPDCPGKLKQVQEWKKVASAKEIESV